MEQVTVKKRGNFSLDIKTPFLIRDDGAKEQKYKLELFVFLPYNLNIDQTTMSRDKFYEQLQINLRLNTPGMSAAELLDKKNKKSPLFRMRRLAQDGEQKFTRQRAGSVIYEANLFACIFRSLTRDSLIQARQRLGEESPGTVLKTFSAHEECAKLAKVFHKTVVKLEHSRTGAKFLARLRAADEFVSLRLEQALVDLLQLFNRKEPGCAEACDEFRRLIKRELGYRKKCDYWSGQKIHAHSKKSQARQEAYAYHVNLVRKQVSQVLYLKVRRKKGGTRLRQVSYALAAGLAMLVAGGIAWYLQKNSSGYSWGLLAFAVLTYMLKDRIKDGAKSMLSKIVGRYTFYRRQDLFSDLSGSKLAELREWAGFIDEENLRDPIRALRRQGSFRHLVSDSYLERVLSYRKQVKLYCRRLGKVHTRIRGVVSITRLNMRSFLKFLQATWSRVPVYGKDGHIDVAQVQRTTHVNVVLAFTAHDEEHRERFRMVVDDQGIRRIEPVSAFGENSWILLR